jgi:hypothetical protein
MIIKLYFCNTIIETATNNKLKIKIMTRVIVYKKATQAAIEKGWKEIKIVHINDGRHEYKEFYYVSRNNGLYLDCKYRTVWIKF